MILLALSFGLSEANIKASHKMRTLMDSSGALMFAGIGFLGILAGGKFLAYEIIPLPIPPVEVSLLMVILVSVAIGIHIMAVVVSLFFHIAEEGSTH